MKFKHFTMEELNKMTRDQQRGYLIGELVSGACNALLRDTGKKDIYEGQAQQVQEVAYLETVFKRIILLLKEAVVTDSTRLEEMLQQAVLAPNALNYK